MAGTTGSFTNKPQIDRGTSALIETRLPGVNGGQNARKLNSDLQRLYGTVGKRISQWRDYQNEDTKTGVLFDLAKEGSEKLIKEVIGKSKLTNIFFKFYEPYFKLLREGLVANDAAERAVEYHEAAYNKITVTNQAAEKAIAIYEKGGLKYIDSFGLFSSSITKAAFHGEIRDLNNIVYSCIRFWVSTTCESIDALNFIIYSLERDQSETAKLFHKSQDGLGNLLTSATAISGGFGTMAKEVIMLNEVGRLTQHKRTFEDSLSYSYRLSELARDTLKEWKSSIRNMAPIILRT